MAAKKSSKAGSLGYLVVGSRSRVLCRGGEIRSSQFIGPKDVQRFASLEAASAWLESNAAAVKRAGAAFQVAPALC